MREVNSETYNWENVPLLYVFYEDVALSAYSFRILEPVNVVATSKWLDTGLMCNGPKLDNLG